MPPLGVEAVAGLLRALKPLDPLPRVPLDARTADSSYLIAVGAPSSGRSSFTPSYYGGSRRVDHVELIVPSLAGGWRRQSGCN